MKRDSAYDGFSGDLIHMAHRLIMPPKGRRRRMPRVLCTVLLVLLVLASIAIAAVVLRGRELAEEFIGAAAARSGAEIHGLKVESVGLTGLVLGPLRLGGAEGPSASNVRIEWRLSGLLRGQLHRVRVEDLQFGLALHDGEFAISGLPAMGASNGGLPLKARHVEVPRARIRFATELGSAAVSLAASMSWSDDGEAIGNATFDALILPTNGPNVRLSAAVPALRLARDDQRLKIEAMGAELESPTHGIVLSGIAVTGLVAPDATSATLQAEMRDLSAPAGWRPLKIALDGHRTGGELSISGRAQTPDRALTATIRGRHNLTTERGTVTIEVAPIRFKPGERQPSDFLPGLASGPNLVGGSISGRSTLSWHGRDLAQSHIVILDDVRFESGITQVSALNGRLMFDSLVPLRTQAPQRLRADVRIASLPSGPFELLFSLSEGTRLRISEANYAIAGGMLALAGVTVESGRPVDAALEIRAVDLGTLLRLIGVDSLSGSGALDGRVPVHVAASGVAINNGRLAAKGSGIVRYTGAGLRDAIAATDVAAGDTLKLLQEALTDFHYTELTMTLDRSVAGDGSLLVHLKGANPAVLDGHPFNLNIRLDANFDRLATILLDGYAAAKELLEGSIGK